MRLFSARRLFGACILCVAAVAALVAPGAASANSFGHCEGVKKIVGFGSSLQSLAQKEVWTVPSGFNSSSLGCTKEQEEVEYKSASSGEALESWGVNGHAANFGPTNAYTATDQPANEKQAKEEEAEANGGLSEGEGKLRSIPVLQAAVAIVVHLPKGCLATSTAAPGRLVLKNATLEKIFEGKDDEWGKAFKSTEGGDKFENAPGETCVIKKTPLTRVVRAEGSGTTATFKKYLNVVDDKPLAGLEKTWVELAEEVPNTVWPKNEGASKVLTGVKGPGVVAEVVAHPGTVGYANLADARNNSSMVPPTGGSGTSTFWIEIEHGTKPSVSYADPADNGDVAAKSNANCEKTVYTNGKKKFPPPDAAAFWNEVTTSKTETNYTICGLTYDQALTSYSDFSGHGGSEQEARSVNDFLGYALSTAAEGGQTELLNHDYLPLTEPVLKEAQEGAKEVD